MVKSALLLHNKWCRKILECNKVWELRSKNCQKRGRVGIACTSKSSPNKTTQLLGEVTLVDSIEVAEVRSGLLVPPKKNPENFLFLKEHAPKHQVYSVAQFPCLMKDQKVFAWVLKDPILYKSPRNLKVERGCVVWTKISPA